jgi:Kelch motif
MKTISSQLADVLRRARGALLATTLMALAPPLFSGWTPLANTPPGGVALMLLLSDGTVMAQQAPATDAVGTTFYTNTWYRLTPANGSYANGTWTELAPMLNTRLWYSSVVLRDGRVLIAGGEYGTGGSTAEIYDPVSDHWTMTPPPGMFLSDSVAKILRDGRVLERVMHFC